MPKFELSFLPNGHSVHKYIYLTTFFLVTPATILISVFTVNLIAQSKKAQENNTQIAQIQPENYPAKIYASLPREQGEVLGVATASDARVEIVKQYLHEYDSPLEPYANLIVDTARKYDLDFRLLTAIAQQESNLCKKIPENSHNCWGWGIHSRGTLKFESYEQAIEEVSKGLKEEYLDKGYTTPEQIMAKYTPSSPGSWANGVSQFLEEMK